MDNEGLPGVLRIAIQDRRRLFREGLALILTAEPDLSVVALAATAQELVRATEGHDLDLVLLELDCVEWDPCRLAAALCRRHGGLVVVGTTAGGAAARLSSRAYRAGVRTVFPRDAGMRTLLHTIRGLPVPPRAPVAQRVVDLDAPAPSLSRREVEVLAAISTGATTHQVAHGLGIRPKTVENHKQRIFSKLGVQNQAHAVAVATRRGLLVPAASPRSA